MAKTCCTCGCGRMVTHATKQNHLRGRGTIALQARVLDETESLRGIAGGRQERVLHQNPRKRGSSGPDQGTSSCKRLKASQLEASPEPEASTFQADIDLADDLADPFQVPALVTQSSNFVERTRHTMEQHWGARRDNGYNIYDGEGDNVDDENDATNSDDGDEDDEDKEDEDDNEDNEDNEDKDSGDNGEDESDNEDNECNHPGFSLWDKLGEDFEREAASLSLSSFL